LGDLNLWSLIIDYVLKFVGYLFRFISKFRPSIEVEVQQLYCRLVGSDPFQTPTVLTAWTKKYVIKLMLVNRKNSVVFVKDILLVIGNDKKYRPAEAVTEIGLEPHQAKIVRLVFPISDKDIPLEQGSYELSVVPTSGKQTVARGYFPVEDK
jgi:hypothetical protein